ncbi:transporter substrate-binding domain-containing protein [Bradyrhizobium sp. Ash2021]|uniref:transporter substrate-binding domain-containing protein n=1 Tax=Bradyrhizobium sp. Ash2021 TaxID=2954771 RepID=UPI002815A0F2|nr:transporter substrate-binding domain-containing protein [Bradyrhizobium sp. Ash2021]WMT71313.1 transporter substrate-binding domain-containing protein [Bradyrhizobium sp. Ash2021]
MKKPSIPLGLVFSQSGPYAMMAGEMLKSAWMAIDEVNQSHEFDFTFAAHLRDPGGVVAAYHDACADLIRQEQVEHIVGCYTSASRKQVIPIVERTERLLWHPARYEGFESSDNVIYVGAAPNHNVVPLVRHMLDHISSDVFCIGSNYVWTWETNRVIREIVTSAGGRILAERLLELGETAVDHIVREIIDRKPPVVFNTLVGESSYAFVRALHEATTRARLTIPMLSCSLCEPELKLIGPAASVGCITSSAYFESIDRPQNRAFVARWRARHGTDSNPSVDGQSTYVCVMLLARAIRRAGTTDVAAVRRAAANHRYESPQGPVWVDPDNNHCFLTPRLARSVPGCQFEIFWEAEAPERPDPYLSNLDLATIGMRPEKSNDTMPKRANHLRVVK